MENLQNLEMQVLIDMLVRETTSYTSKLSGRIRVNLAEQEYEISLIVSELNSRTTFFN